MVIFRENTEDIYAGLEVAGGDTRGQADDPAACNDEFGWEIRTGFR